MSDASKRSCVRGQLSEDAISKVRSMKDPKEIEGFLGSLDLPGAVECEMTDEDLMGVSGGGFTPSTGCGEIYGDCPQCGATVASKRCYWVYNDWERGAIICENCGYFELHREVWA